MMQRLLPASMLAIALLAGLACEPTEAPPSISITLNGIPSAMNGLLVVPPSGFVVNLTVTPGGHPIVPASLQVAATRWGGGLTPPLEGLFVETPTGAIAEFPSGYALEPGSYTLIAVVRDSADRQGSGTLSFAVRAFPGPTPPIGSGQQIWYDFAADRDAVPGPDFDVDLQHFGLGSPLYPALSAVARDLVVERVLARVEQAYDADGSGLDGPVAVTFTDQPPSAGDVTRICVGGEDPTGGSTVGSIQIDPGNAARNSVECGTIPPTGVFPRELLGYAGQTSFANVFDPLRPAAGGVPIGASIWDLWVLHPSFDPETADPPAVERWEVVTAAIDAFGNALGSILAHETGHALGLVPPGPPGGGLFGGSDGVAYAHALNPDGTTPVENFLMKAGNTFNFARLAGLGYSALPVFRPIELAYLHDRVVLAPQVTQILPPPTRARVVPAQITGTSSLVTILGGGRAAIPAVRLVNPGYTYSALGEAWQSAQQMTCWVVPGQLPVGLYDLEVTNPDGQKAVLPDALQIY
jgi:hypothetical protein